MYKLVKLHATRPHLVVSPAGEDKEGAFAGVHFHGQTDEMAQALVKAMQAHMWIRIALVFAVKEYSRCEKQRRERHTGEEKKIANVVKRELSDMAPSLKTLAMQLELFN